MCLGNKDVRSVPVIFEHAETEFSHLGRAHSL